MAELCRVEEAKLAGMTAANLFDRPIEADSEVDASSTPRSASRYRCACCAASSAADSRSMACTDLSELGAAEEQSHLQNALLQ
jgi:hypothetical protein